MHEILTVQLGHSANYLATHFWNAQESYFTYDTDEHSSVDHDICFRPGINAKGEETYTPRTLVYDLKGGFGGLRKWGGLYDQQMNLDERPEEDEEDGIWYVGHGADGRRLLSFADHGHGRRDGNVSTLTAPTIPQHGYQTSLEQDDPQPELLRADPVRYWSDFNHVFYHPRSIVPLNDYELNSSILPFEKFETGDDLFRGIGKDDDNIMDRDVRPWAEESDHMQGIQIFANDDNAWAGFASRYIEALRDEYGKLPIWLVGVGESGADDTRAKRALKALNASKLICDTSDSLFVPVIVPSVLPPYVQMDRQSLWQRSALLATAVESATLPSRLRDNGGRTGHLGDLGAFLNFEGKRNIAQLQFSAMNPAVALTNDSLAHEDMDLFGFEGPEGSADHTFGVVKCIRGRSHELTNGEVERSPSPKRQMLDSTLVESFSIQNLLYPTPSSFPSIFTQSSHSKVSISTSLSTSTRLAQKLRSLWDSASIVASYDEREELRHQLLTTVEAYKDGWEDDEWDSDD